LISNILIGRETSEVVEDTDELGFGKGQNTYRRELGTFCASLPTAPRFFHMKKAGQRWRWLCYNFTTKQASL
jgi:hypothetical protein